MGMEELIRISEARKAGPRVADRKIVVTGRREKKFVPPQNFRRRESSSSQLQRMERDKDWNANGDCMEITRNSIMSTQQKPRGATRRRTRTQLQWKKERLRNFWAALGYSSQDKAA